MTWEPVRQESASYQRKVAIHRSPIEVVGLTNNNAVPCKQKISAISNTRRQFKSVENLGGANSGSEFRISLAICSDVAGEKLWTLRD